MKLRKVFDGFLFQRFRLTDNLHVTWHKHRVEMWSIGRNCWTRETEMKIIHGLMILSAMQMEFNCSPKSFRTFQHRPLTFAWKLSGNVCVYLWYHNLWGIWEGCLWMEEEENASDCILCDFSYTWQRFTSTIIPATGNVFMDCGSFGVYR